MAQKNCLFGAAAAETETVKLADYPLAHLVGAVLHEEDVGLPDLVVLGQGVQRVVRPGQRAVKTDKLSQHLHFTPLCGCEPAGGRSIFGALGTQSRKSEVEKKLSSCKLFSKMLFSYITEFYKCPRTSQHYHAVK